MQPLIFFFAIFEFLIIVMTINGIVVCFSDHFRYWFFRELRKIKRMELFHKIKDIDELLTVSSNDKIKSTIDKEINFKSSKLINLK